MGPRRNYSDEFKAAAVDRLYEPGATQCGVAKELGISGTQLKTWRLEIEAFGFAEAKRRQKSDAAELERLSRSVEDKSDAFIWDMINVSYDGAGQRLQQTNSYDNGRVLVTDFAAGVRSGSVMTDADDVYAWESLTDIFDVNGDRTERSTLFDDGRVVVTSYVDDLGLG